VAQPELFKQNQLEPVLLPSANPAAVGASPAAEASTPEIPNHSNIKAASGRLLEG